MSEVKDRLQKIESKFNVDRFKVNGQPFWPFFRAQLYAHFLKGLMLVYKRSTFAIIQKIINASHGFSYWFQQYDYVVFSNELERKHFNGRFIDKLTEGLMQTLGYEKTLYIEQVSKRHLKRSLYGGKRVVSMDLIILLSAIVQKLNRPATKALIEGDDIWNQILQAEGIQLDYEHALDIFLSKVNVIDKILERLKPRKIFVTDYGNLAVIYAAKRRGIQVIEFQHGVIGNSHPHYQPAVQQPADFCPDFIFVFGQNDVNGLSHGRYVSPERVIPVGNYYLASLAKQPPNESLTTLINNYRLSIGVPTDFATHDYLLSFIRHVAVALPDCIFFVCPRRAEDVNDQKQHLPENLRIVQEFSYQELIRHCDYNASTNSTCCLEALSLGARNILIDEDGLASRYFGHILTNSNTCFVKTTDQFISVLKNSSKTDRCHVQSSNKNNFMSNYDQNLQFALKLIEKKKIEVTI